MIFDVLLWPLCACSCTHLSTVTQRHQEATALKKSKRAEQEITQALSAAPSCTGSIHPLAPLALLFPTQIASKRNRLHLGQLPRRPGCSSRTMGRICGRSHGHAHNPSTTSPHAQEGELGTGVLEPATPDCHPDLAACQHPNLHTPPYSVWEVGSEGPQLWWD